jgi:hypothetical protein
MQGICTNEIGHEIAENKDAKSMLIFDTIKCDNFSS